MKYQLVKFSCSLVFTVLAPCVALSEELNTIFTRVNKLVQEGSYTKALEELSWAKKEIEKLNSKRIGSFFPDSLAGFSGEKAESSSALGFSNFERMYSKGEAKVKVSLTGGSAMGENPFGNLAALGKMAAMFGQQNGQETFRIAGRTATLDESSGAPKLTVFLDSGSILALDLESGQDSAVLREVAGAIKIEELDGYLKGSK